MKRGKKRRRLHRSLFDREDSTMGVVVGKEAPGFKAEAFHQGMIEEVRLEHYRGRWAVLFFYPADFTCV